MSGGTGRRDDVLELVLHEFLLVRLKANPTLVAMFARIQVITYHCTMQ